MNIGGVGVMAGGSRVSPRFDFTDRSEFERDPVGRMLWEGDAGCDRDEGFGGGSEETEVGGGGGGPKKNGPFGDGTLGLMGEVAIGTNWGSTGGFFTAVNRAARKRRGPAGFGMIITSGTGEDEPVLYVVMIDCTVSFRCL